VPAYDRQYDPPAPVAELTVTHPVTGVTRGVARGKLDTGAGLSIIPERLVAELALRPHGQIWARSYDGAYSRREVYFARFAIEGHELGLVQCLAIERDNVLLGRNVLNRFVITLDGPELRVEMRAGS
jgi:predicted aspartyl protease